MKWIKTYKLFESSENKPGHKFSWEDILDRLTYLTDLGFQIDMQSKNQYFRDDEGDICDVTEAHWLVTEINLTKDYFDEDSVVSKRLNDGRHRYYCKWDDRVLELHQEIEAICSHFDECYYNVSLNAVGWQVSFIIWTSVEQSTRESETEKKLKESTQTKITNAFESKRRDILDSFTPVIKNKICKNKIGETMWNYQGSYEDGYLVMPINFEGSRFTKSYQEKLDSGLSDLSHLVRSYGKVELRKITEADIDKLFNIKEERRNVDKNYFTERYLGLMAYIIEFDYEKMFSSVYQSLVR